jgi:Tol biopolymer transport system component
MTITDGDATDVWATDIQRGSLSRLTFDGNSGAAVWSPDGRRITFSSDPGEGSLNLYTKGIGSSEPPTRLTTSPNAQFASSWSPDGRELAYTELNPETQFDIWTWSAATGRPRVFLNSGFNESAAVFSPNGGFIAYVSDETGEDEVYVCSYPDAGAKWPISTNGGREPVWSDDGSEIYYRGQEWMIAVSIETEPSFSAGKPRLLFEAPFDEAGAPYANYEVTDDRDDFIMVRSDDELSATRIVVVLNWFQELLRRVPEN